MNTCYWPMFLLLGLLLFSCNRSIEKTLLFVGSYTDGVKAEGIYVFKFNTNTGTLKEVEREGNLINPSFITISPNGKYLYACTESKMEQDGSITSFKIDANTGEITFLNKQSSGGRNPAHVVVDSKTNTSLHQTLRILGSAYLDAIVMVAFHLQPNYLNSLEVA